MSVQLDRIFRSLSDRTRRDILKRLVKKELSISEIAASYDISLAMVSKHLKTLEMAGLLGRRREGRWYILRTNVKPLKQVDEWIDFYRKYWDEAFNKLDEYLTGLQKGGENNDSETS
ncbi:MAG: ArsR/SmtB family transcription factor [Candidatus Heimdallarchaeota archaeon]